MDLDPSFVDDEGMEDDSAVQVSFDVETMVKKARRSRKIAETDVQAILASADEEQADRLYVQLQRLGIRIVSEDGQTVDDLNDAANLLDEIDPDTVGQDVTPYMGDGEEDPVHTYLKDIGRVPLLTAEQEIWLATELAAASALEQLTTRMIAEGGQEDVHIRTIMANYEVLLQSWEDAELAPVARRGSIEERKIGAPVGLGVA